MGISAMSLRTAAVALFIGAAAAVQPKGNVTIYGDMNVQGSLRTTSIQSSNLTVDGSLNVNADLKASKLKVDNLHADSVETMVRSCFRYGLLPQRFFCFFSSSSRCLPSQRKMSSSFP